MGLPPNGSRTLKTWPEVKENLDPRHQPTQLAPDGQPSDLPDRSRSPLNTINLNSHNGSANQAVETHLPQAQASEGRRLRSRASRTKIKCTFGPSSKQKTPVRNSPPPASTLNEADYNTCQDEHEMATLLREIDRVRSEAHSPAHSPRRNHDLPPSQAPMSLKDGDEDVSRRPTSRRKQMCRFGPYRRSGPRHASPDHDSPLNQTGQAHHELSQQRKEKTLKKQDMVIIPEPSRSNLLGPLIECPPGLPPIGPSRVTLMAPMRRSPFDRYRKGPSAPLPITVKKPRFAPPPLGISEEERDAQITAEVDEILTKLLAERRWEEITANSSKESPRILTKEDCMNMFIATGIPPPGALRGVYKWASSADDDPPSPPG